MRSSWLGKAEALATSQKLLGDGSGSNNIIKSKQFRRERKREMWKTCSGCATRSLRQFPPAEMATRQVQCAAERTTPIHQGLWAPARCQAPSEPPGDTAVLSTKSLLLRNLSPGSSRKNKVRGRVRNGVCFRQNDTESALVTRGWSWMRWRGSRRPLKNWIQG